MKIHKTLSLDSDVVLAIKKLNINVSNIVNSFLKNYISQDDKERADGIEIETKLEETRKEIINLKIKEEELITQKIWLNEKKRQEEKKNNEIQEKIHGGLKASGILRNIGK